MSDRKDDDFEDDDLDNYDSDFDDMDFGFEAPKDRSPAGVAKESVGEGLKGIGKGSFKTVGAAIEQGLPSTTGIVKEAGQFGQDLNNMKYELLKDVEPAINTFKQVGASLLPKAKRFIPNKLYNSLNAKFEVASGFTAKSEEAYLKEERDNTIQNALSGIFQVQEDKRTAENEEARVDRFVDRRLGEIKHEDNLTVLNGINNSLYSLDTFTQTTHTAYLKKSLELKYKHLFVAQDTLSLMKLLTKVTETKLEEIKHNTGLPDIQKQRKVESLKAAYYQKVGSKFSDHIGNFTSNALTSIKTQVFDKAKDGLKGLASNAEMAIGMSDAMEGMGDSTSNAAKAAGMGGGLLGSKLINKVSGSKLGGKVLSKLAPAFVTAENATSNIKTKGLLKLKDLQNSDNGVLSFIANLLPQFDNDIKIKANSLEGADEIAEFDNLTKQSIVEIIPGYLSKILKSIMDMSTGKDNEELVFDPTVDDFTTVSEFKNNVLTMAVGDSDNRTSVINKSIRLLNTAKKINTPEDNLSFEDHKEDITKIILNHAYHKVLLKVGKLENFANSTDTLENCGSDYVRDVLKGTKAPKASAALLVNSLTHNNEIDDFTLNKINDYIIEQMEDEKYREILPSIISDRGTKRYLKEFIEDDKLKSSTILDQQFKSIDVDKNIQVSDSESYKKLLTSQRAGMKALKEDINKGKEKVKGYFKPDTGINEISEPLIVKPTKSIDPTDYSLYEDTEDTFQTSLSDNFNTTNDFYNQLQQPKYTSQLDVVNNLPIEVTPTTQPKRLKPTNVNLTQPSNRVIQEQYKPISTPVEQLPLQQSTTSIVDLTPLTSEISSFKDIYETSTTTIKDKLDLIIKHLKDNITSTSESNTKLQEFLANQSEIFKTSSTKLQEFIAKQSEMFNMGGLAEHFEALKDYLHFNTSTLLSLKTSISGETEEDSKIKSMFGTVGSGVYKTGKSIGQTIGKGYKSLYDNTLKGVGKLSSGAIQLGTGALSMGTAAMPGIMQLGNTALTGGLGLVNRGIDGYSSMISSTIKGTGKILNSFGIGSSGRGANGITYFNVYRRDEVDAGNPLLSKRQQEKGLVFQDGDPLKRTRDLIEPIFDPKNKEVLVTEEDIRHGLVDIDNESIYESGNTIGIDLVKKTGGLFSKTGKLAKKGFELLTGNLGSIKDLYGSMFSSILDAGKGMLNFGKDLLPGIFGDSKETSKWRVDVLSRLDTIVNRMAPTIEGDLDGDGDREGSYKDQMEKKAKKKALKESSSDTNNTSIAKKSGALGLLSMFNKNKDAESSDTEDGTLMSTAKLGMGAAAYEGIKKIGGKALVKLGLRKAGTAAAVSAATGGGGLLAGAGSAIAGTLASIPVAGWIALGTAAVGYGAYRIYKSMQPTEGSDILLKDRMRWYGIPKSTDIEIVYDLEERFYEYMSGKKDPLTLEEYEDFAFRFGIDTKDPNKMNTFIQWINKRFIPSFAKYGERLLKHEIPYEKLEDIEKDDVSFETLRNQLRDFMNMNKDKTNLSIESIMNIKPEVKPKPRKKPNIDRLINKKDNERQDTTISYFTDEKPTQKSVIDSSSRTDIRDKTSKYDTETSRRVNKVLGTQDEFNMQNTMSYFTDDIPATSQYPDDFTEDWIAEQERQEDSKFNDIPTIPNSQLVKKTKDWIKGHEGLRLTAYNDSLGKNTIGYGHLNIENYSKLTKAEADALFEADYVKHVNAAKKIPEFNMVDPVRQAAFVDLTYNLGLGSERRGSGILGFKNTRRMIREGEYDKAAKGLLNSTYAKQVKGRANEVAKVIESGDPKDIKPRSVSGSKVKQDTSPWDVPTKSIKLPTISDKDKKMVAELSDYTSPTISKSTKSPSGYMAPNITTKSLTSDSTSKSTQKEKVVVDKHGEQQVKGLNVVADKIESLKALLSEIFGTGEVFNDMNAKLQASIEKEPVVINQVTTSNTSSNRSSYNPQTVRSTTSNPTINVSKSRT